MYTGRAPEFVVSGLAGARGDPGLALGNLVGSNIINVTLILGVAGIVAPIAVHSSVPHREARSPWAPCSFWPRSR